MLCQSCRPQHQGPHWYSISRKETCVWPQKNKLLVVTFRGTAGTKDDEGGCISMLAPMAVPQFPTTEGELGLLWAGHQTTTFLPFSHMTLVSGFPHHVHC